MCGMYGGQIMPPGDLQVERMMRMFERAMYERAAGVRAKI